MDFGILNKNALVTASSDGIGKGIAKVLVSEGAQVSICSRDIGKLENAARETGASHYFVCDLTSFEKVREFTKDFEAKFGIPDILVINTAGPPKGNFSQLSFSDWAKGFEIIWGPAIELTTWAIPRMKEKKWGRIIFSTSLSAKEPIGSMLISGALRAGISNLAHGLAREVAAFGITVNAVLPGWTNTSAVRKMGPEAIDPIVARIPLKRLADPLEIGQVVAFLSSEQSSYLTGQAIAVDGGILQGL